MPFITFSCFIALARPARTVLKTDTIEMNDPPGKPSRFLWLRMMLQLYTVFTIRGNFFFLTIAVWLSCMLGAVKSFCRKDIIASLLQPVDVMQCYVRLG